jgi:hypothetical protein
MSDRKVGYRDLQKNLSSILKHRMREHLLKQFADVCFAANFAELDKKIEEVNKDVIMDSEVELPCKRTQATTDLEMEGTTDEEEDPT